jgi:hypothetical protein
VVLRCVALGWVGLGLVGLCCVRAHVHVWVCCVWEWGRGWGFLCALTLCACVRVCVICICMCVHVPFLEEPRKPSWPEQIFLFLQPLVCHIWQIRRKPSFYSVYILWYTIWFHSSLQDDKGCSVFIWETQPNRLVITR